MIVYDQKLLKKVALSSGDLWAVVPNIPSLATEANASVSANIDHFLLQYKDFLPKKKIMMIQTRAIKSLVDVNNCSLHPFLFPYDKLYDTANLIWQKGAQIEALIGCIAFRWSPSFDFPGNFLNLM